MLDDARLRRRFADDTYVHQSDVRMHRAADGWKMVVPGILVDVAASFLVHRTGG